MTVALWILELNTVLFHRKPSRALEDAMCLLPAALRPAFPGRMRGREALQAPRPRPRAVPGASGGTGRKIASMSGTAPCDLRPVEPRPGRRRVITKWADGPLWAGRTRSITCSAWTTRTRESYSIRRRRLDGRVDDLETFNAPLSVSEPATNDAHLQLHSHLPDRRCQHQEWASPPRMRWTVRLGPLNFYQRPCQ